MKVFFNASISGKKKYINHYKQIIEAIGSTSNKVVAAPVNQGNQKRVANESEEEAERYYRKLSGWIKSADVAVFEVSHPSLGIGYEVSYALNQGKPVIALHVEGKEPFIFESIPDDKLQVVEYDEENLLRILADSLDYAAEQMDTRFNFFISPKIASYLDWIARDKRIPRAVYLRNLIKNRMVSDKEYQEDL